MERYDQKSKGTLMKETHELCLIDGRSSEDLYFETGLPIAWLKKFRADSIDNPSVNRIQYLYEFLTEQKIEV